MRNIEAEFDRNRRIRKPIAEWSQLSKAEIAKRERRQKLVLYLKEKLSINSHEENSGVERKKQQILYIKEHILLSVNAREKKSPTRKTTGVSSQIRAEIESFYRQQVEDGAAGMSITPMPFVAMDRKYGLYPGTTGRIIVKAGLRAKVREVREQTKKKELQESNDLAWFIGALLSGGKVEKKGLIAITSDNKEVLTAFKMVGDRLFADEKKQGTYYPPRKPGQNSSMIFRSLWYARAIGDLSRKGKVKTMKEQYMWVFDDEHIDSFAGGVLDGGGKITLTDERRRLDIFSTNKEEVDLYKTMFIKLGIRDWNYANNNAASEGINGIVIYSKDALRTFATRVVSKSAEIQKSLEQLKALPEEHIKKPPPSRDKIIADYQKAREILGHSPTVAEWSMLKNAGEVTFGVTTLSRYFGEEEGNYSFKTAREVLDGLTTRPTVDRPRVVPKKPTKKAQLVEEIRGILKQVGEAPPRSLPSDDELAARYHLHRRNVSIFLREAGLLREWRDAQKAHLSVERKSLPQSEAAAWVLGVLVGGYVSHDGKEQISLSRNNPDLLNMFQAKGEAIFPGVTPTTQKREKNGISSEKRGFYDKQYAAAVGDMRRAKWAKTIKEKHPWILNNYEWAFLAGYMEVSGAIEPRRGEIKLFSLSRSAVELLITMLRNVGIKNIRIITQRTAKERVRGVAIRSDDCVLFARNVQLVSAEKEEKLAFFR